MIATMDSAGRVVIPREVRRAAGLIPGPVDISLVGAAVRIEAPTAELVEQDGFLFLPSGLKLNDDELRELRLADQR
jgi:bifunctional DNA-binding transcriptional regulator/antitoxin component of YhaV-PrlF toxin-antitoxin module